MEDRPTFPHVITSEKSFVLGKRVREDTVNGVKSLQDAITQQRKVISKLKSQAASTLQISQANMSLLRLRTDFTTKLVTVILRNIFPKHDCELPPSTKRFRPEFDGADRPLSLTEIVATLRWDPARAVSLLFRATVDLHRTSSQSLTPNDPGRAIADAWREVFELWDQPIPLATPRLVLDERSDTPNTQSSSQPISPTQVHNTEDQSGSETMIAVTPNKASRSPRGHDHSFGFCLTIASAAEVGVTLPSLDVPHTSNQLRVSIAQSLFEIVDPESADYFVTDATGRCLLPPKHMAKLRDWSQRRRSKQDAKR